MLVCVMYCTYNILGPCVLPVVYIDNYYKLKMGCMCMMLWVLMVSAESSRTSVLVSILSHKHFSQLCQPCVYNVRTYV